MGLIMTKVKLTNFSDAQAKIQGILSEEAVRTVEIEALVDTGAINLAIPEDVVELLGVPTLRTRRVRVADGRSIDVREAGALNIEVLGREMTGEAIVLPRGATPLLGVVHLELLDLVLVPRTGEVITNPAHPHGPIIPLLRASSVPRLREDGVSLARRVGTAARNSRGSRGFSSRPRAAPAR